MYQDPHQAPSQASPQGADGSDSEAALTLQLQRRNTRLVDHVQHYKAELKARFEELGQLTSHFRQAEQALEEAQAAREDVEQKVAALSQQLSDVTSRLASSEQRCESLHDAKDVAEDEKVALRQALADSQAKMVQQKRDIERQNYELAELVSRLETMNADKTANGDDAASTAPSETTEQVQAAAPSKAKLSRWAIYRQTALLRKSGWFDARWYLEQNPDIAANMKMAANPERHYLLMGGFEGRNPCPGFDSAEYLRRYPDVAQTGINPLVHFLKFGLKEQRIPRSPNE